MSVIRWSKTAVGAGKPRLPTTCHPKCVCTPNSVFSAETKEAAIYLGARSLAPSSGLPDVVLPVKGGGAGSSMPTSYLALLRVGFALPFRLPGTR